jgi:SMODS-associating 4TM effector domain
MRSVSVAKWTCTAYLFHRLTETLVPPTTPSIRQRQNDTDMVTLLRAASVSHLRTRRLDTLRTTLSTLLAASGLAAALTTTEAAILTTILGGAWALAYSAGLASWSDRELGRSALLQEMFDTRLFGMHWNTVAAGEQLEANEVSRLNQRYRGQDNVLHDYYEVPELPRPYDVLACQLQNLGWGARIRRRYARAVAAAGGIWVGAGLVMGGIVDLSLAQLMLRWYIPSLGALLLCLDIYRGQCQIATERHRILSIIRTRVSIITQQPLSDESREELLTLARQVQDRIFHMRRNQPRVPKWFFNRYIAADRTDFQADMIELAATLKVVP